ncbi:Na/Pi cotransporter family protein [Methanococcus voltae]|uniref:Na/Pi-cotransporter II-related protein n=1 Tax=Methanococcus voltae (strain ATCC BAA-1334 / A3) TaxID=456320 RepID=D7DTM6_METV3|nr:Na/Pi cotransporter family protein [Methanococcus voltae]MCS3901340.1 phosphate:Na+ symporter [Methanococcus voltae]
MFESALFETIAGVVGGLALFLYGMTLMGNGLQKVAGDRLKKMIEVLTKNKYMGVLVGAVVTMIIQSSSATTVMVVGFVNASLMTLYQAIGVIMGANIGTTVTAQLVAFKLTHVAPLIVASGVALYLASKKRKHLDTAEVLIGFGILFLGMAMMSAVLKPLAGTPAFEEMLMGLENPFLGIFVGFIITVILQSSSATTGLLLAVAASGGMSLEVAFPIIFGQNIGTCVTAILSSIGASRNAKRAAIMHLLFNLIGTSIFMILIYITPIITIIQSLSSTDIQRQIANAHTLFNVANTLMLLPFAGYFVYVAEKILPIQEDEREMKPMKYVDKRIVEETPSIGLLLISKEVLRMGKTVGSNIDYAMEALMNKDEKLVEKVRRKEKVIDYMAHELTVNLIELSNKSLSDEQHAKISVLTSTVTDLERIGDIAEEIAEKAQYMIDENLSFSEDAVKDLNEMYDMIVSTYARTMDAYKSTRLEVIEEVIYLENEVDKLEKSYRKKHIKRLKLKQCSPKAGIVFLDVISYFERISDHSSNIAKSVREAVHGN